MSRHIGHIAKPASVGQRHHVDEVAADVAAGRGEAVEFDASGGAFDARHERLMDVAREPHFGVDRHPLTSFTRREHHEADVAEHDADERAEHVERQALFERQSRERREGRMARRAR